MASSTISVVKVISVAARQFYTEFIPSDHFGSLRMFSKKYKLESFSDNIRWNVSGLSYVLGKFPLIACEIELD